jgi:glycosyltransferase involved in cell wall biosynthesis
LIIPTTDWLGHPFPSRLHHIFEKIAEDNEVHVLRFSFYDRKRLETRTLVHEMRSIYTNRLATYYVANAFSHFNSIRAITKTYNIDVVVMSNLLTGYIATKAVGNLANMVFDLSDYFPASAAGYYFDLNSLGGRIVMSALEKLLKKTLKRVKLIITCSNALMYHVKRLGIENVTILPNGVDEFFLMHKHDGTLIREKYGLNGYVTIGYVGSIEFWLNMLPLLKSIKRLTRLYKVKLLLVGTSLRTKAAEEVMRQIKRLRIQRDVVWLKNFIPYYDVPSYVSAMDICTIPFDHCNPAAYYSAPNKLWEYLALEKPVMATPIPDLMICASQFVEVVRTSEDYTRVIEDYIRDPDRYKKRLCKAKRLLQSRTWTIIAKKYEQILASLA